MLRVHKVHKDQKVIEALLESLVHQELLAMMVTQESEEIRWVWL